MISRNILLSQQEETPIMEKMHDPNHPATAVIVIREETEPRTTAAKRVTSRAEPQTRSFVLRAGADDTIRFDEVKV